MRMLSNVLVGITLLLTSCVPPAPVIAGTDARNPPPCNVNPCVITYDSGGLVAEYEHLSRRVRLTGLRIEIDGECYSACAILADKARPFVCLTHNARLFFHQTAWEGEDLQGNAVILRAPYEGFSEDVNAWIELNGGQPLSGWLYMPFLEARKFWPSCTGPRHEDTTDE
jgi:hypothetical protein